MNPYDATMRNIFWRLKVWLRGMLRLYRRPLAVLALAGATMVASVSADQVQPRSAAEAATETGVELARVSN
jgi:hypothetical protein